MVLLGLVFIALSLHLEKAQTAAGPLVVGLGGQTLSNYVYVLMLSLGDARAVPAAGAAWVAAGSARLVASGTRLAWRVLLFGGP